jgi:hypothetical protein
VDAGGLRQPGAGSAGRVRVGASSAAALTGASSRAPWPHPEAHERERGETGGKREGDGEEKLERSRSVPQNITDGADPHLASIFLLEPLCSHRSPSKQPRERIGSATLPRLSNQTHGTANKYRRARASRRRALLPTNQPAAVANCSFQQGVCVK